MLVKSSKHFLTSMLTFRCWKHQLPPKTPTAYTKCLHPTCGYITSWSPTLYQIKCVCEYAIMKRWYDLYIKQPLRQKFVGNFKMTLFRETLVTKLDQLFTALFPHMQTTLRSTQKLTSCDKFGLNLKTENSCLSCWVVFCFVFLCLWETLTSTSLISNTDEWRGKSCVW